MKPEIVHQDVRTLGGRTEFALPMDASPYTFVWPGPTKVAAIPARETGLGPYTRALAELYKLKRYKAGWNGPRSSGADKKSFDLAISFLELLADRLHTNFAVEPSIFAEGTAVLEVVRDDLKMFLEFTDDGFIAANVDKGTRSFDFDLAGFDGSRFPDELGAFFQG